MTVTTMTTNIHHHHHEKQQQQQQLTANSPNDKQPHCMLAMITTTI